MSESESDFWRGMKDHRKAIRERFGIACPTCTRMRPNGHPTIMLPQQKCRVCGHLDDRPELTDQQYGLVDVQTVKDDNGISYSVLHYGLARWTRRVDFGHDEAHRAGGREFVEAAREQEREVRKLLPQGAYVEEIIDATIAAQARRSP